MLPPWDLGLSTSLVTSSRWSWSVIGSKGPNFPDTSFYRRLLSLGGEVPSGRLVALVIGVLVSSPVVAVIDDGGWVLLPPRSLGSLAPALPRHQYVKLP
jgi:hypothetical protein